MRKAPLNGVLLRLYQRGIALYPQPFRERYVEQVLIAVKNASCDARNEGHVFRFWFELGCDLLASLCREHQLHLQHQMKRQPVTYYTIVLILTLTLLGGVAAVTAQQMLRRGADQPQIQMADLYARKIAAGAAPASVIPPAHIDLAESLEPFLIFYDDQQRPLTSNGFLDAVPPIPPSGVFAHTRSYGKDKVTWQPRPDVRIAAVARRVEGPHAGFLLAGRSLRVVEEYESNLFRMTIFGWVLIMALLTGGALFLTRVRPLPQVS